MLTFYAFFAACTGHWSTERTYHFMPPNQRQTVERSHTEFTVTPISNAAKAKLLAIANPAAAPLVININQATQDDKLWPGFAIDFATESETGDHVAMSLQAVFIPDALVLATKQDQAFPAPPLAAQVASGAAGDLVQGFYLRDQGYAETGAIAGRFTYLASRQTLEMTTYYEHSVAVDQMRLLTPNLRLRTIVNYQRPGGNEAPSIIELIGFGTEIKTAASP